MIIIVDGIDRVGKSTLCKELSTQLDFPIYKKERAANSLLYNDYEKTLINIGDALAMVDIFNSDWCDNLIIDRFYWTEYVYSKCDRHSTIFYDVIENLYNKMLICKNKYLFVYVRPVDLDRSSREHGKDLSKHLELFDTLYRCCPMPKMTCTYSDLSSVAHDITLRALKEIDK